MKTAKAGADSSLAVVAFVTLVLALSSAAHPARATDATALTLSRRGAEAATLELTLENLAALPQITILTGNEFSNRMVAYSGPLVRDVIAFLGLGELEILRFTAANDYHVEIPTSDFTRFEVVLAMRADGAQLSRRQKGPLWLMYPVSEHDELRDPVYVSRLIWQVVRIEQP